ncbi:MAG: helix-turn-helix transcriptional regulator [Kutzneria sp.]|nr:helix-turn-helix transcriptional regulator [Kutzneria sp.]
MTDAQRRSFAEILDQLCTSPPAGQVRLTNAALADVIRARGGTITHTYISQLRKGDKDNPSCRTIEDLAAALGVHPAYFVGGRGELRQGESPRWRPESLRRLSESVYPTSRGPFSPEEVASRISSGGQYGSISASYVRELLTGVSDNPRLKHVLGLADFYGADPAYFFDDELAARIDEQLEARLAMDKLGVNTVILRATEQAPSQGVRNKIMMALVRALKPDADVEDVIIRACDTEPPHLAEDDTKE